ncbi:MAG TPA: UDP-N-acetylmuramoyl-tripeptide--D-alanyl-D-alanine ligase [Labilithrix sp.]|jgi:UDP-N-acetylmuramoyl-tripeptide--D-alanyl-D-alanine ligase
MATPIPTNRARFSVDEIASATRGSLVNRGVTHEVVGLTTDSRAATTGAAFVALRGENSDGHAFVEAALGRAGLAVVERGRGAALFQGGDVAVARLRQASVVEVDDTLVAWGDLARAHLAKWRKNAVDPCVVAITGSAGKTTTKELTAALLAAIAPTHFTAGNLNNRIGVPAVVFALNDVHRFCVLEMGMSLPGELDAICSFAKPDVAVVTNVGVAHAEGVGGREGVMREKGAVYRALDESGVAVVNADDDFATRAASSTRGRVVTFGRAETADYRLVAREPLADGGSRLSIAHERTLTIQLPLPGEAAAIDLVAALAAQEAASAVELTAAQIESALATVQLEGRSTLRKLDGDVLLLDDTYNANPQSMRAALATLAEVAGARRRVAVIGEMKELGALAEEEHTALGDAIADAGVALAIGCGGLAALALGRAARRGVDVVPARSTDDAAREATARVRPGDAVLVKASRSVGAERVVETLQNAAKSAVLRTE